MIMKHSYKQVIVVRKDLNMRKGKLAAQVGHAVLNSFIDSPTRSESQSITLSRLDVDWLRAGSTKIVVGCQSLEELMAIRDAAVRANITNSLVLDAGRTEFKEPTYTCCAVGPYY